MTCYVCGPRECGHAAPIPRTTVKRIAPARLTDDDAREIVLPHIPLSPRPGTGSFMTGSKWLANAFQSYLLAMGFKMKVRVRHDPEGSRGPTGDVLGPRTTTRFQGWTCGCIDAKHPCERHKLAVRDYKPRIVYVREIERRSARGRRKTDRKKSSRAS